MATTPPQHIMTATQGIERIDVADGKYTVVIDNGKLFALRYGQPWQDLTGNNLVYWLATELQAARAKTAGGDAPPVHIHQHVRHRDYCGKRVTGTVRGLTVEGRELMATIALDAPIVIPARGEHRQIDIHIQCVPAHELAPFDERDEEIVLLRKALAGAAGVIESAGFPVDVGITRALAYADGSQS